MRALGLVLLVLGCGEAPPTVVLPAGYFCLDGTEEAHPLAITLDVETDAGRARAPGRVGSVCARVGPGEHPVVTVHAVLDPPPGASPLVDEPQELHCMGHASPSGVVERLDCRRHGEQLGTGDTHCLYDVAELRLGAASDGRVALAPIDARFRGGG